MGGAVGGAVGVPVEHAPSHPAAEVVGARAVLGYGSDCHGVVADSHSVALVTVTVWQLWQSQCGNCNSYSVAIVTVTV